VPEPEEQKPAKKRPVGRPRGKKNPEMPEPLPITKADVQQAIDASPVDFQPSALQEAFAKIILTSDQIWRYTEIAEKLGVTDDTVSGWFNDQRFRIWYENVRARLFLLYKPPIDRALLKMAATGSIKHIELFYAMVGDLVRTEEEKSAEIRRIDSMSTFEQYTRLTQKISTLSGRMGAPVRAEEKDAPARIELSSPSSDDDE
jgi:hypothetical protein